LAADAFFVNPYLIPGGGGAMTNLPPAGATGNPANPQGFTMPGTPSSAHIFVGHAAPVPPAPAQAPASAPAPAPVPDDPFNGRFGPDMSFGSTVPPPPGMTPEQQQSALRKLQQQPGLTGWVARRFNNPADALSFAQNYGLPVARQLQLIGAAGMHAVTNTLGLPVDLATGAINLGLRGLGLNPIGPLPGGAASLNSGLGAVGNLVGEPELNPDTFQPQGFGENAEDQAIQGVIGMMLPGGIAGKIARDGALAGRVVSPVVRAIASGNSLVGAASGALGGAGGELASEMAPDGWKGAARFAGNLGFGAIPALAEAGVGAAARAVGATKQAALDPLSLGDMQPVLHPDTGQPVMNPRTGAPLMATPAQQAVAGRSLARAAGTTPTGMAAIADKAAQTQRDAIGEPTLAESTQNPGLAQRQRTLRNAGAAAAFNQRSAENNTARAAKLVAMAGPEEARSSAASFVSQRLREIDATSEHEAASQGTIDRETGALPRQDAAASGAALRGRVDAAQQPAVAQAAAAEDAARQAAEGATAGLPGGQGTRLSSEGATIQNAANTIDQAHKDEISRVFNAIDPTRDATANITVQQGRMRDYIKGLGQYSEVMEGKTGKVISDFINHPSDEIKFTTDLKNLRSRATEELRNNTASGPSNEQRAALRTLVENIDDAVTKMAGERNAADAVAVESGHIPPTQSTGARLAETSPQTGQVVIPVNNTVKIGKRVVPIKYKLVEGSGLQTSHDLDGNVNPKFGMRNSLDRSRKASRSQVASYANAPDFSRLGASSLANDGAPIIEHNGNRVISGNARTMTLKAIYAEGGDKVAAYHDMIRQHGLDPSGFKQPVMVRQIDEPIPESELPRLMADANNPIGLQASDPEAAIRNAARITHATTGLYKGGDIASRANAPFVRAFLDEAAPVEERGTYLTNEGQLSEKGRAAIESALTAKAFPDPYLQSALSTEGDEEIKSLRNGIRAASPSMAKMRTAMDTGRIPAEADLTGPLSEAVQTIVTARVKRLAVKDLTNQLEMFGSGGVSGEAKTILEALLNPDMKGRISAEKVQNLLETYAARAEQAGQGDMLGRPGNLGPRGLKEIADENRAADETRKPTGSGDLFKPAGNKTPGANAPGPGPKVESPASGGDGKPAGVGGEIPATEQVGGQGGAAVGGAQKQLPPGRQAAADAERPNILKTTRPLTPQEAAAQATARAAHAVRMQTFHEGLIGKVLARGKRAGEFATDAQKVAEQMASSKAMTKAETQRIVSALGGATDAEAEAMFREVVPTDPATGAPDEAKVAELMGARRDALQSIRNSLGFSLRRAAEENGTINVAKANRWLADHAETLDSFPELRQQFKNAADARGVLDDLRAQRAQIDKNYPIASGTSDVGVTAKYWRPGPGGIDGVESFLRDSGGGAEAQKTIEDAAASSLADAAFKNGKWSDAGYQAWMKRFSGALSRLPDLAGRLGQIGDAQAYLERFATERQAARDQFEQDAARFFMNKNGQQLGPLESMNRLMGSPTSTDDVQALTREMSKDPAAAAGLKRMAVDWFMHKVETTQVPAFSKTRQLSTAKVQQILGNPRQEQTLRAIIGDDGMRVIEKVAQEKVLEQQAQQMGAIPGSPGTAADQHALDAEGAHSSLIGQLVVGEGLSKGMSALGAAKGIVGMAAHTAGLIAPAIMAVARSAGFQNVRDLETAAMLDAPIAKMLAGKAITDPKAPIIQLLGQRLRALAFASSTAMRANPNGER
jgi:hypothetical protein